MLYKYYACINVFYCMYCSLVNKCFDCIFVAFFRGTFFDLNVKSVNTEHKTKSNQIDGETQRTDVNTHFKCHS